MGQAKQRGTFNQRLANALDRKNKLNALHSPDLISHIKREKGNNHLVEMAIIAAAMSVNYKH